MISFTMTYLRQLDGWENIDPQTMNAFRDELQAVTTSFEVKESIKVYRYVGTEALGGKDIKNWLVPNIQIVAL